MAKKAPKPEPIPSGPSRDELVSRAAERWPRLPRWQGIFLNAWKDGNDRLTSLALADAKLFELEEALEMSEKFAAAYETVMREIVVTIEDAQVKAAIEGKNSGAQKLALEAFSPRYQKKTAAKRGGQVSAGGKLSGVNNLAAKSAKTWGAIFESTRPKPRQPVE